MGQSRFYEIQIKTDVFTLNHTCLAAMKDRTKKDRTYDADGYTKRAGCLCFRTENKKEVIFHNFDAK